MKKSARQNSLKSRFTLRPSDWAIVPLGILTVYAWHHVLTIPIDLRMGLFSVWYQNILFHPSVAMVAIAIFGSLYIYRDVIRKNTGKYARGLAYFFAVLTVIYLFVLLSVAVSSNTEPTCVGIMGAKATCAEVTLLQFYLLIQNPFSLLLWGVLGATGILSLLFKMRQDKPKSST